MANAITQAGGMSEPTSFAPLHTNRMFTGLWTNRNPLTDASVSTNMEKYGLGLQDSIIAGLNTELSSKLTLRRRFGTSVYNSQIFPPITRYYPFNTFTLTAETIRVMADTAATVYDATGPNTKNAIWQKSPGAGPTFFLGVGNNLYFTNGVDNKQWNAPAKTWTPNTTYYMGDTVLDTNGGVQKVVGFAWQPIATISVSPSSLGAGNQANIALSAAATFGAEPMQIVVSNVPGLNSIPFNGGESSATQFVWFGSPSGVHQFAATATGGFLASVRNSGGLSGGTVPVWQEGISAVTGDNQILWASIGPTVVNWGIQPPLGAPTVSQSARQNPYPAWQANTAFGSWWLGQIFVYDPTTNTMQSCTIGGTTGTVKPAFSATNGTGVADGSTAWVSHGTANWQANHSYRLGDAIAATLPVAGGSQQMVFAMYTNQPTGQTSGATAPPWPAGLGSLVVDGLITWINVGNAHQWADIGAQTVCAPGTPLIPPSFPAPTAWTILDPNGYIQILGQSGKTGASAPTFNTSQGGQTTDGNAIWINSSAFATAATAPAQYGYAYKNSVTSDISNMSPASAQILLNADSQVLVQGLGSTDPQVDIIYIYRTAQGGSTFLYVGQIPNTPGATWSFTDTTPDSGLNVTIQAQVNNEGSVLPRGATCMTYHLQRTFVAVGNVTYVSTGPDAIASTSSGNSGFRTTFTCQSKIIRYWVSPLGLVIFTVRDSYIILGSGTDSDPLYQTTFIDGLPLAHYDAFTTHLTTPYMLLGTGMLVALDPSAGITEVGFPIADKLADEFDPTMAYVTYHSQASKENALYVDDGLGSWYRMSATTAPETGLNWSPKATLNTPSSAVQSVEITPGVNRLLIGPGNGTNGPIRMRDLTTNTDLGVPFTAHTTFGSIVLAHPGELAQLAFFTLEARKVGSRASLSVLLGEIFSTSAAPFEPLGRTRQDPPNLPPSNTLYSDRYHFMQSQNPAWCRHFQMDIAWPAEDAANELLTYTIFGQTWQEYRSQ
jgi:hypothetical protein